MLVFQPSVDLRFQNTDDFYQRIEEIDKPIIKTDLLMSVEEVQKYNEMLQSSIVKSRMAVEQAILDSSRKVEQKLLKMAQDNGLISRHNAGWAWVSDPGKRVDFTYALVRKDAWQPEAENIS